MTVGAKVFSETGTMTVFGIGGWVSGCIIWKRHTRSGCMRWAYHIISWVYGMHLSKRACNGARKHHTTQPAYRNGRVPL